MPSDLAKALGPSVASDRTWWVRRLPLALAVGVAVFGGGVAAPSLVTRTIDGGVTAASPAPPADRTFTILGLNDLYRIEGLLDARAGGLARVRTLRTRMEAEFRDVLVLHAGDFLYPSLMSNRYDGAQMIDILNVLDGDSTRFDERFVVTFGNHEFDRRGSEGARMLQDRISESQFRWLASDIVFGSASDSLPVPSISGPQLQRSHLVSVGGVWVGIFSLTLPPQGVAYVVQDSLAEGLSQHIDRARARTRELRDRGAEFIVALTHLPLAQDVAIIETLGPEGPDLIVGGHEHDRKLERRLGRYVVKADADGRTAASIRVRIDPRTGPDVSVSHHELGPLVLPDSSVDARVERWQARLARDICGADSIGCLERVLTRTDTDWDAEESEVRAGETAIGDWIADIILDAHSEPPYRAEVALVNTGAIRLNQHLEAGSEIRRRHLEELIGPFNPRVVVLSATGDVVRQVLERSAGCRGEGAWLAVSGLRFRMDPASGTVDQIEVAGAPVSASDTVRIATLEFLTNPDMGNQDGYTMVTRDAVRMSGKTARDILTGALTSGRSVAPRQPSPSRITILPGEAVTSCD